MTTLVPKFEQPLTGAVNRAFNLKLQESISVLDFINASDVGTTNDVTYAFTAALATKYNVYVPPGTYYTTGNLTLNSNQVLFGDNRSTSILKSSITTGNFITAALGARVQNLAIIGVWTANSSNTSIALYGGFGGYFDGGISNCFIQYFYIGLSASNSIQTFENNIFTNCNYGYKSVALVFNDSIRLISNWFTYIGQTITATPSSVTLSSGQIYNIVVPNASIFEVYTPISQATTNAQALIQAINTGTNTLTVYVISGTFNTSNLVTNFQGACMYNTYRSLNAQYINNQCGQSTNFINNGGQNGDIYLINNWCEQITGSPLISSGTGSYVLYPSAIHISGVTGFPIINDPTVSFGFYASGSQVVTQDAGTIPGSGLTQVSSSTASQPLRTIYTNGYQTAVSNAIVAVMGLESDASDNGYAKQYIWNMTVGSGNVNAVLNLGYASNYSNTYGTTTPIPLTANIVSFGTSFFAPSSDNAITLGTSSNRWSTVYAATGTINTSDGNQKTVIGALTIAEQNVAKAIKGLFKTFKFNDAIAKKGVDKARIHVGVVAQDVQAAFVAQGLDPNKYALFCSDTWYTDENGIVFESNMNDKNTLIPNLTTHTQLGVRYEELLAFVISAI